MIRFASILLGAVVPAQLFAGTMVSTVKVLKDEHGSMQVVSTSSFEMNSAPKFSVSEYPQFVVEHQPVQAAKIVELVGTDDAAIQAWLTNNQVKPMAVRSLNSDPEMVDEVRTIVNSGPSANRIDLVFMGDGYTAAEREKFFTDMTRLVNDMFIGKTFTSYLPVFNVHAVFRPSNRSGIGRGSAVDTAYGLYREGETLRAIFPSKPLAIRESCRQAPGCDYPVVIANDPYYGGLGGEFAISTSSATSGTVVLRHELGHNFGRVGEEYDGGGYFGANYSMSATSPSWRNWATNRGSLSAEPMVARYIAWPWHKLNKGPFTANFSSDGRYVKTWMRLSASGIETSDTLGIKLDGAPVAFESPNRSDRSFVNIPLDGLTSGSHSLVFNENVQDNNNWLSSLTVHEYGENFHDDLHYIGSFPNFDERLEVDGYRPTNESCLMRDMTHEFFCPVCQENNWSHFFAKIDLIDSTSGTKVANSLQAEVKPIQLGQFRSGGTGASNEHLEIRWFVNGVELPQFSDQSQIQYEMTGPVDSLEVEVKLVTSEIRNETVVDRRRITL